MIALEDFFVPVRERQTNTRTGSTIKTEPGVADRVWGVMKNGNAEDFTEAEQEKCQKLTDSIQKKLRNDGDKKNAALALCMSVAYH